MSRLPPVLLAGAYAALMLAWVFGNPPGAGYDENAHYVRALGVAQGHLAGMPVHGIIIPSITPDQVRRLDVVSRTITIADGLVPRTLACDLEASAACLNAAGSAPRNPDLGYTIATLPDRPLSTAGGRSEVVTYEGTYPPYLYIPPSLVMAFGHSTFPTLWAGRLVNGLICAILLGLAIRLVWSGRSGPSSLAGVVLATTPMVIFCSSYLSPSGPEITGAICFWAAILRVIRDRSGTQLRASWIGMAAGGTVLAASRPQGPLWVFAGLAFLVASLGIRPTWRLVRERPGRSLAAFGPPGLAIVLNLGWELAFQARLGAHPSQWLGALGTAIDRAKETGDQFIGVFGWGQVSMDKSAYVVWWSMALVVVGLASILGHRRQLWVLAATIAAAVVMPVALALPAMSLGGYENVITGRHVLPFAVSVTLVAAEMTLNAKQNAGPAIAARVGRIATAIMLAAAAVQAMAWYNNGRHYAGTNRLLFWQGSPAWSPPLGWLPWLLLAALGVLGMAGAAVKSLADLRHERTAVPG